MFIKGVLKHYTVVIYFQEIIVQTILEHHFSLDFLVFWGCLKHQVQRKVVPSFNIAFYKGCLEKKRQIQFVFLLLYLFKVLLDTLYMQKALFKKIQPSNLHFKFYYRFCMLQKYFINNFQIMINMSLLLIGCPGFWIWRFKNLFKFL